jgi:hypothetical protein
LYGELLQHSFRFVHTIDGLAGIRLLASGLLGLVAVACFAALQRLKWDWWTAALMSALVVLLPSTQILVSWAVAWPRCVALLLSIAAFVSAEKAFRRSYPTHGGWWALAVALITTSALVYPTDTLLYVSFMVAGLWSRRRWSARNGIEWIVRHATTLAIGLGLAFTTMTVAFARGWVPTSTRVALEHDWAGKLVWFVREPLQNALALIVLRQDGGSPGVHRMAALVGFVIIAGLIRAAMTHGRRMTAWWSLGLVSLVMGSFTVNLIAADRWSAYRVLLPLATSVAIALVLALHHLGGRGVARTGLVMLVVPGVWLACRQSYDLVAWPQSVELKALETGAVRIDPAKHPRVFVLTPRPEDHVGPTVSLDEFGSLSTDSDWVPKEMLKLVMKDRYPGVPDVTRRYSIATGRIVPDKNPPDVVIDLQHLRDIQP